MTEFMDAEGESELVGQWVDADGVRVWRPMMTLGERRLITLAFGTFVTLPSAFVAGALLRAVVGKNISTVIQAAGWACGAAAVIVGLVWARRMIMGRVSPHDFVYGTTTLRSVAAGFVLMVTGGLAVQIGQSTGLIPPSAAAAVDTAYGVLSGLIGPASLVTLAGAGYGEYRKSMATVHDRALHFAAEQRRLRTAESTRVVSVVHRSGEETPI